MKQSHSHKGKESRSRDIANEGNAGDSVEFTMAQFGVFVLGRGAEEEEEELSLLERLASPFSWSTEAGLLVAGRDLEAVTG